MNRADSGAVPGWIVPAVLFAASIGVRLAVIAVARFDGLYGQDPFAYLDYARRIFATSAGAPLAGAFYWPLGYPALASLVMHITGPVPAGAQIASILAGSAIAPLAHAITREVTPARGAAFAAGAITVPCGQLVQSSISIMSDAAGLFWASLAAWALLRHIRTGRAAWLPAAGLALAFAAITRWLYLGLAAPIAIYALSTVPRRRWVLLLLSAATFAAVVGWQVRSSEHSPAPVFSHGLLAHWSPANALRTSFDTGDGHFDYRFPPAITSAYPAFHPYFVAPLLAPFVALGAWRLRRSATLILFVGWITVFYIFLAGLSYENNRFGLSCLTPIAVMAGIGIFGGTWPGRRLARALLVASLLFALPFAYRGLSTFLAGKAREMKAVRYAETLLPRGSTVVSFGLTLSLAHYTDLHVVELAEESPSTLRDRVASDSPVYLFVPVENIESQWAGKPMAETFRWLRGAFAPREIGRTGAWTLFEIGGRP